MSGDRLLDRVIEQRKLAWTRSAVLRGEGRGIVFRRRLLSRWVQRACFEHDGRARAAATFNLSDSRCMSGELVPWILGLLGNVGVHPRPVILVVREVSGAGNAVSACLLCDPYSAI